MALTMADFSPVDNGAYFTRVTSAPDGLYEGTVEVMRLDGANLGAVSPLEVDNLVAADKAKPLPPTGGTLKNLVERPVLLFDASNPQPSSDGPPDYSEVYATPEQITELLNPYAGEIAAAAAAPVPTAPVPGPPRVPVK